MDQPVNEPTPLPEKWPREVGMDGQDRCYFPGPCACIGMCVRNRLLPCCQAFCSCNHAEGWDRCGR
jgi:hypothetical protein